MGVFLGKCVWTAVKTMVVGVGTAAKYCELKRCADRVRSRTDSKDEVVESKFSNLNFLPST